MLLLVALVALTSCGDEPDELRSSSSTTGGPAVPASGALVAWCAEVEPPGPVTDGNLAPTANPDPIVTQVINAYAVEHPDTFGGTWIDRAHGGTVVVAFTDNPAPHRSALAQRRASPTDPAVLEPPPAITDTTSLAESGVVVDVVQVRFTADELDDVQEQAGTLLGRGDLGIDGTGQLTSKNRVSIHAEVVDDDLRRRLANELPVEAVCIEGTRAEDVPPSIDPAAPPALLAADGEEPMLVCGYDDLPFPASALDQPGGFETTDDPLADVLRRGFEGDGADMVGADGSGWRVLHRDDQVALLADEQLNTLLFRLDQGRWAWGTGSTSCTPMVALPPGVGRAAVALDPAHPGPGPSDTEIHLLVNELGCASGTPIGDRLIGPQVRVEDDRVLVATAVAPLGGSFHTCPGIMAEPVTVTLDEPLGDRLLVDGLAWPATALGPPGEGNGVMAGA